MKKILILGGYGYTGKDGVYMMGYIAEPEKLFKDIQKMGARVIESLDLLST